MLRYKYKIIGGIGGCSILIAILLITYCTLFPVKKGSDYAFVKAFGSDRLDKPIGTVVVNNRLYVSDSGKIVL